MVAVVGNGRRPPPYLRSTRPARRHADGNDIKVTSRWGQPRYQQWWPRTSSGRDLGPRRSLGGAIATVPIHHRALSADGVSPPGTRRPTAGTPGFRHIQATSQVAVSASTNANFAVLCREEGRSIVFGSSRSDQLRANSATPDDRSKSSLSIKVMDRGSSAGPERLTSRFPAVFDTTGRSLLPVHIPSVVKR